MEEGVLGGAGGEFGLGGLGLADHGGEGVAELLGGEGRGGVGGMGEECDGEAEGGEVFAQHGVLPGAGLEFQQGFFGFADEGEEGAMGGIHLS